MRLTIVGSGDAFGSGGRFNTCFMLETGSRRVMLDFGATSLVALRLRDIAPDTIDGMATTSADCRSCCSMPSSSAGASDR